jgi:hypothetical protein
MKLHLTTTVRRALRLRTRAENCRADAQKLCFELMRHAAIGVDLKVVQGLSDIAAEQWLSAQELEETRDALFAQDEERVR